MTEIGLTNNILLKITWKCLHTLGRFLVLLPIVLLMSQVCYLQLKQFRSFYKKKTPKNKKNPKKPPPPQKKTHGILKSKCKLIICGFKFKMISCRYCLSVYQATSVVTHFEKNTHIEKKNQTAFTFRPNQSTSKFLFIVR